VSQSHSQYEMGRSFFKASTRGTSITKACTTARIKQNQMLSPAKLYELIGMHVSRYYRKRNTTAVLVTEAGSVRKLNYGIAVCT
jgi:hypothetical protein